MANDDDQRGDAAGGLGHPCHSPVKRTEVNHPPCVRPEGREAQTMRRGAHTERDGAAHPVGIDPETAPRHAVAEGAPDERRPAEGLIAELIRVPGSLCTELLI